MLKSYLMDIEAILRNAGFWSDLSPDPELLLSRQPFCVDTLEFDQWLQWVFIPTLTQLLDDGDELPANCGIAPMASEWAKSKAIMTDDLVYTLQKVDLLVSQS